MATQEEVDNTVAVMGGEDWQMWISALGEAGVLADGAKTTAYTYIGEKITWDIPKGISKPDLEADLESTWRLQEAVEGFGRPWETWEGFGKLIGGSPADFWSQNGAAPPGSLVLKAIFQHQDSHRLSNSPL